MIHMHASMTALYTPNHAGHNESLSAAAMQHSSFHQHKAQLKMSKDLELDKKVSGHELVIARTVSDQ